MVASVNLSGALHDWMTEVEADFIMDKMVTPPAGTSLPVTGGCDDKYTMHPQSTMAGEASRSIAYSCLESASVASKVYNRANFEYCSDDAVLPDPLTLAGGPFFFLPFDGVAHMCRECW